MVGIGIVEGVILAWFTFALLSNLADLASGNALSREMQKRNDFTTRNVISILISSLVLLYVVGVIG